jgi:hypothetical protein
VGTNATAINPMGTANAILASKNDKKSILEKRAGTSAALVISDAQRSEGLWEWARGSKKVMNTGTIEQWSK